ncbi:hypothetical protein [Ottowia sp.]|uniref:hypothetical protein n=1 Tax=Ottowia sp. TaxID=1898956 RepID=UPI0039E4241A
MHPRPSLLARALPRLIPLALACAATAQAQPTFSGYLCCNMRTDGRWISDINYVESGKQVIPAGTPVTVIGYGRQRVLVTIDGQQQALGNDYSRELSLETFARRYVVPEDPRRALAAAPAQVRRAVESQRLVKGMTREQVAMSVGWPVTSENPQLDARLWRFWLGSFEEFQVRFDDRGRVAEIEGEPMTLNRVRLD